MNNLRQGWLKFGCFLTGFNFAIIRTCSEMAAKRVLRYTSALLIICLLWAFIGFLFTQRYLKGEWYSCLLGAVIMVFLIIQIERQIILSTSKNKWLNGFRVALGLTMAVIGTLIIDQIIFSEDINKRKLLGMDEEVKKVLPAREATLSGLIAELNRTIESKESERKNISDDISKNPFMSIYDRVTTRDTITQSVIITKRNVPNPKTSLLEPLDRTIADLRIEKAKKESMLLSLRPAVEAELKEHVGFLDELNVMIDMLSESISSFIAWSIWVVLLLILELLVLVSKFTDTENDYDRMENQQMQLHFRRIELLSKVPSPDKSQKQNQSVQKENREN